jgi:hypothetical protein
MRQAPSLERSESARSHLDPPIAKRLRQMQDLLERIPSVQNGSAGSSCSTSDFERASTSHSAPSGAWSGSDAATPNHQNGVAVPVEPCQMRGQTEEGLARSGPGTCPPGCPAVCSPRRTRPDLHRRCGAREPMGELATLHCAAGRCGRRRGATPRSPYRSSRAASSPGTVMHGLWLAAISWTASRRRVPVHYVGDVRVEVEQEAGSGPTRSGLKPDPGAWSASGHPAMMPSW